METPQVFARCCCLVTIAIASNGQCPVRGEATSTISVTAVLRHDDALEEAHDVELHGNRAYVACKGGSIAIIDIVSPDSPRLVWYRRDPGFLEDAETVLLASDRLFLGTKDLHSINLTDSADPRFDAHLADRARMDTINGMARRGQYLIAACKQGSVAAVDISNPKKPRIAGVIHARKQHAIHWPHDVDLITSHAVVVDPNAFGTQPGQLALFRIFDRNGDLLPDAEWELVGRVSGEPLNGANRVQVQGQHAYVAGSYFPKISQGKALAKGVVIDLSKPSAPRIVATVNFPDARGPNGLTVTGNVWFLAGGQTVQAYDVSDPQQPRVLFTFTSQTAFPTADDNAHDLVYRDGYLYVTSQGDNALVVLKTNDPELRRLAGQRPPAGARHGNAMPAPGQNQRTRHTAAELP